MGNGEGLLPFFDNHVPFRHRHPVVVPEHVFAALFSPPLHKIGEMVFAHGARSGWGITLVRTAFNHTTWINHVVDSLVVVFMQYAQRPSRLATGRRRTVRVQKRVRRSEFLRPVFLPFIIDGTGKNLDFINLFNAD